MDKKCKCGQPVDHIRVGLCSVCYRIYRKKQWKINHVSRISKSGYLEDRRLKNKKAALSWQKRNRDKIYARQKDRCATDLNFKLSRILRKRISEAVKNNHKSGSAIENLGCSIEDCRVHLENKFQSGMSWNNYGQWHIDHIVPLSKFNLAISEELKQACHYTNLQPLWSEDNLSKGAKVG